MSDKHACTAECWAHMIRYGAREGCDPFTARQAARADLPEGEGTA